MRGLPCFRAERALISSKGGTVRIANLGSGSEGNATLLAASDTKILIDIGFRYASLKRRLSQVNTAPEEIQAVVITHTHNDHVVGLAGLLRRHTPRLYLSRSAIKELPLQPDAVTVIGPGGQFTIGAFRFEAFPLPHDASETLGFAIYDGSTKVGYAVDLGSVTPTVIDALQECDFLITETNHDLEMLQESPYPWAIKRRIAGPRGHLSNREHSQLLHHVMSSRLQGLLLAHISRTTNHQELAIAQAEATLNSLSLFPPRVLPTHQHDVSEILEI